jgi:dehydrogenase/reductase SDR family protein 12
VTAATALETALETALDTALDRTLLGYGNVGYLVRRTFWAADPTPDALRGKVAIVTGANSGLGKATTGGLARLGASVHMIVRRSEAGLAARADILASVPGADLTVEACDVSSLAAVRRYAQGFEGPLHVLVHNAGVMPPRRTLSADGHELSLATHVLGPHLLTGLLRPALTAGAPSRVIWTTSGGMYAHKLPDRDLEYEQGTYRPAVGYARTKRMQAVLAQCWAEQLRDDDVVVNAVHPGWAATPGVTRWLPKFRALTRPLLRTPEQGADTAVWMAAAGPPGENTGRLWHDRAQRPWHYSRRTRESAAERQSFWDSCQCLTRPAP